MHSDLQIEPYIGEPDKARFAAALKGEKTDRVPNFEVLIEDEHVTKLLGRHAGNTLAAEGDPGKGSEAAEEALPMDPQDYIELCHLIGQDVIICNEFWAPIKTTDGNGNVRLLNDRSFKSRSDLDRVIWPGEEEMEKTLRHVSKYVDAVRGTKIGVVFCPPCMFTMLYEYVIGMNDAMIMIHEDRELFEELMSRSADYAAELSKRTSSSTWK